MHHVDRIMVDHLSDVAWFHLDLNNYQKQLVNGYTRMTPGSGLADIHARSRYPSENQDELDISMEWLKHGNMPCVRLVQDFATLIPG
jgi:hypothetical protein